MSKRFITSLALSHFRSHRRLRLDLDGRPVVLFGANGAGKTNILEAVSLLSPGRGLRRAAADEIIRRPEAIGWRVSAEISGGGVGHDVALSCLPEAARVTEIDGKPAPQLALSRVVRMVWLVPSQDRLWLEGADGRRRFLDRMVLSLDPDHGARTLTYEKAMRDRNRLLKDGVQDPAWYRALEAQMAEAGAAINTARRRGLTALTQAQDSAETPFPAADLALEEVADALQAEALVDAFAQARPRDMAAGRSLIGPHRSDLIAIYRDKGVSARLCSTGEQKALLISLVLANARALRSEIGVAPLILLDEVAAHLDANRRAALFDEICALECQAWMTGTGSELFAEIGDRAQQFEVVETGGARAA